MIGVRYALMYPDSVDRLALVDPIGLEDWKAKGVPWQSVDAMYQKELQTTADGIREYERTTYYAVSYTHLDVYKRQIFSLLFKLILDRGA